MLHELKTWPESFDAIADGRKRYERRRADRPYHVGDRLRLRRWEPVYGDYSTPHRQLDMLVTYMGTPAGLGLVPLVDEVLMSIEKIDDEAVHTHLRAVGEALRGRPVTSERELGDSMAARLTERGLAEGVWWRREVRLATGDRIDFVVAGSIGIELKIKGGWSAALRQLDRYAEADDLTEVWLFTTRRQLAVELPAQLRAKPIVARYIPTFA